MCCYKRLIIFLFTLLFSFFVGDMYNFRCGKDSFPLKIVNITVVFCMIVFAPWSKMWKQSVLLVYHILTNFVWIELTVKKEAPSLFHTDSTL